MRPLLLSLPVLLVAGEALGHGAIPASSRVVERPGAPAQLAVATSVGTLLSKDRGETWDWVCEEAQAATGRRDSLLLFTASGKLLVGDFFGLSVSADGCSWRELPEFVDTGVSDLQVDPVNPAVHYATTARFGVENGVFKSADDGETFLPLSLQEEEKYFSAVRGAPSLPARLYASAWWYDPQRAWLYRSEDGGESWAQVYESPEGESSFSVLAVSPVDEDVVFASIRVGALGEHELRRSTDGGATFALVAQLSGSVRQVVLSPDGQRAWLSTASGLFRSLDGGLTFQALPAPRENACIAEGAQSLLVCGAPLVDGWAAARAASVDGGPLEVTSLLRFQDVRGVLECPTGTATHQICTPFWPSMHASFQRFAPSDGGMDGGRTADAGAELDAGASDGGSPLPPAGCGCAADASVAGPSVLLAAALLRRRRRTRTPRST